jgi:hypothetical protein
MNTKTTTGTIKIGRWEYPATQASDGAVLRNTKRDGSGEMVAVESDKAAAFVADRPVIRVVATSGDRTAPKTTSAKVKTTETTETTENPDRDDMRRVLIQIFEDFAVTSDQAPEEMGSVRWTHLARTLESYQLVIATPLREYSRSKIGRIEVVFQSNKNHDSHTLEENLADFDRIVPADAKVRHVKTGGHGGKPGAQVNKPGKSTWLVGDKCPRGTHTLTQETIYRMPSGRKLCRSCRAEYPSNR